MTAELDRIRTSPVSVAAQISQATAVEQARAVAEVQAAVIVAQQNPRDMDRALADMRDACGRMALAERAFYRVPNRGEGPSVHLARELIRIWGNADYGVRELRRDDAEGESEIQAFAWDQQTNVRSTRSFINPHARMASKARQRLVDLTDIYLSNQNVGARAVRECIMSTLPTWFVEEAVALCRQTLEHGEGEPLHDRVRKATLKYEEIGVVLGQLEEKLGRKADKWTAQDVAQLGVIFQSIGRGETTKDEEFPPKRVTAAEITGNVVDVKPGRAFVRGEEVPAGRSVAGLPMHHFRGEGDHCEVDGCGGQPIDAEIHGVKP
jgi:hypothetical protein